MNAGLRIDRIQGNLYPGFNKDEQAFLWLRFPTADSARAWLGETIPELTSARDVIAFRRLLDEHEQRPDLPEPRSTWLNVAFSRAGLDLLVESRPGTYPEAFEQGMAMRANFLNDRPGGWRFGGTPETEAHVLVTLGADTEADLLRALAIHRARVASHGARDLFLEVLGEDCRGAKLPGPLREHEHFGYRDGISKPQLDGLPGTGDFVLGYPDTAGELSVSGQAWTRDGSYLVFRRLRQDVAGFHRGLEAMTKSAGLKNRAQLGAKLVGRWPSGAKLENPLREIPLETASPAEYTAAEFAADPAGERVPLFAHVRKAHPRDAAAGGLNHRLLRRGIPYGPPLIATDAGGLPEDDGRDRGLLFLTYQADLGRQFELVQRWLNDRSLPAPNTGQDAIAGQGEGPAHLVLRSSNMLPSAFDMHHYVSMTGGGYFFTPSLSAVRFLADPTTTWEQQEAIMNLGEFIANETPYGKVTSLDVDPATVVRSGIGKNSNSLKPFTERTRVRDPKEAEYWQGFFWTIGVEGEQDNVPQTKTVRVSKALRIPYEVNGVRYNLIVGFEGAGGP